MGTLTKKPLQIYLRQEQLDALRGLAEQRQVSMAALVRQAVDRLLEDVPVEEDPLWNIVGLGSSGSGRTSARHNDLPAHLESDDTHRG